MIAFNWHAAAEIRRRLRDLIGEEDARRVMVYTYHGLAMRLVGRSFSEQSAQTDEDQFAEVLRDATNLLNGKGLDLEEAEESRDRLLAGFRWIFVDEYQDVNEDQYNLLSALAGRTLSDKDSDAKLTLFAVGDDDQNIYSFNGSSVEFIRRFEADYKAKQSYLLENYRSTRHIIAAANAVIEPARDRMKGVDNEIRINKARAREAAGGRWFRLDPLANGRVQVLPAGPDAISQAQNALAELKRLEELDADWDWSRCAVIAKEWAYLEPVRSLCELESIPAQLARDSKLSIWHLRETQVLVRWLRQRDASLVRADEIRARLSDQLETAWINVLRDAVDEYVGETEGAGSEVPTDSFSEWLAEWCREFRQSQRGLLLVTAHGAKGLEFDHVVILDGGWDRVGRGADRDASRRLYYVAITRARQTLALCDMGGDADPFGHPFLDVLFGSKAVIQREAVPLPAPPPQAHRQYRMLGLSDVFLSFAGYEPSSSRVHDAIAALRPGASLAVKRTAKGYWGLWDSGGTLVGRLAKNFKKPHGTRCVEATVAAIASWSRDRSDPEYQGRLRCDEWEVVVPEFVFEPI